MTTLADRKHQPFRFCTALGWLTLAAMISTFNCLVRSDYNLVVVLVSYSSWTYAEKNMIVTLSALVITIIMVMTEIYDIAWVFLVWDSWNFEKTSSGIWNMLSDLHDMVIILSIVNIVVKAIAIVMLQCEKTAIIKKLNSKL